MSIPISWSARAVPLSPCGVYAEGPAFRALVRRLLSRSDEALASLRGVAGGELVLLLGDEALLPWVDGARYLGKDPLAPSLVLPTWRAPSVSPALLERALGRDGPMAVLVDPARLVPLASARPLARSRLERVLA